MTWHGESRHVARTTVDVDLKWSGCSSGHFGCAFLNDTTRLMSTRRLLDCGNQLLQLVKIRQRKCDLTIGPEGSQHINLVEDLVEQVDEAAAINGDTAQQGVLPRCIAPRSPPDG